MDIVNTSKFDITYNEHLANLLIDFVEEAKSAWDSCVESRPSSEDDSYEACDLLDEAINLVESGDIEGAIKKIEAAAVLGRKWGDDSIEYRMIKFLRNPACGGEA